MERINFTEPDIDIFDPDLVSGNKPAREWDKKYDQLDDRGQLNPSEIRHQLGPRPYEVVNTRPEQTGLYVTIEDRAIALEGIVRYLNKANMTRGGRDHTESGGMDMRRRYGSDLERVQSGAENNRDKLIGEFRRGIDILAATDALKRYGYSESDIELHALAVQSDINRRLGVGNAYAKNRNAVATEARQLADVLAGRKKPRK